jgi:RNA polymerase sigma-70 factor (ECF subfamily)
LKAPGHEPDERQLVEAAQRDPRHFAALYERHFDRVYAFIARRVRDRDVAQDLTSDVFHQALAGLPRFEWRGIPLSAWLLRIAANAVADRWKRAARERQNPVSEEGQATQEAREGQIPHEPAAAELAEVERRAELFQLVESLPADQRRVIELRFAGEQSIREVAHALQRSEGAIKQLQFRALQNLRARIGEGNG